MGYLKEQVSYIRGMADGLAIDSSTKEGKLLLALIAALDEVVDSVECNETSIDELTESVESIKEDIEYIEAEVYGEESDFTPWPDDDEDDDPGFVEMVCKNCNDTIYFDSAIVDSGEPLICPNCEIPFKEIEEV